jgi:spore coat polysaccharide biosynthesis predicted glycosyltransferase SpsG
MRFFENKKILYRFEADFEHGYGHLNRSLEFVKFLLKKKFKVIICTSKKSKKNFEIRNSFFFYKNKNETESEYIKRISIKYKKYIMLIDCKYNYSKNSIKNLSKKNSIVFFQNFSEGINFSDKLIVPDSHSQNRIKKLNIELPKIYLGSKYLILRNEIFSKKKIKTSKYLSLNFGGSDPNNMGEKILKFLIKFNWKYKTYFMLGKGHKKIDWQTKYTIPKNITFCKFNFNKLINSELIISAFGVTTYEIAYHCTKNLIILNDDKKKFKLSNKFINIKCLGFYKKLNYDVLRKNINHYWIKNNKILEPRLILDNKAKERIFKILKN